MTTQYRFVVVDLRVKKIVRRRGYDKVSRIKWWQLKDEKQRISQHKVLEGEFWEAQESANAMWDMMARGIRKVAKVTL